MSKITKKKYLKARRWLDINRPIARKNAEVVRKYEVMNSRDPYQDVDQNTRLVEIPEFNNFNLGAIKNHIDFDIYNVQVKDLMRFSYKQWLNKYGVGTDTAAKIKAAVEAAGLKLRRK